MGFLADAMPKPEPKDITMAESIDFYYRFGNKKQTAERYCITVKEINIILKGAKQKGKNDN